MTDLTQRMRVIMTLDEENTKKAKGEPHSEAVIFCCEAYLRHNPIRQAHDFLTLSQPAEA